MGQRADRPENHDLGIALGHLPQGRAGRLGDDLERLAGERPGPLAAIERAADRDAYEPQTDAGRAALEFFRMRAAAWK